MSDKVFLDIVNMSITGSFAILIIILARLLLKKAPTDMLYIGGNGRKSNRQRN